MTRAPRLPPAFYVLVAAVTGLALAVSVTGLRAILAHPTDLLWIVFLSVANLVAIPMVQRGEVSLGAAVGIASSVVLAPPVAVLVNLMAISSQRELQRGTAPVHVLFNRAQFALCAGAASAAAGLARPNLLLATLVAALADNVVNAVLFGVAQYAKGRVPAGGAAREALVPFPRFALDFALITFLALPVVFTYRQLGLGAVLLVVPPLWLGYSALRSARESEDRAEELALRVRGLEMLNKLGTDLLAAGTAEDVAHAGQDRLREGLETESILVSLEGDVPPHLQTIKIPNMEPAAVGVPEDLTARELDAAADLLGMALQGLELERELAESQQARANLAAQIIEEGNRERSRLALEIHDDVLPYLAAAEIQSDNVRSLIQIGDPERANVLAAKSRDAVHDGIAQLRDVIEALRRQVVVPGELRPALAAALERLRLHHGVQGALSAPDPLPELSLAVEITLLETVRGCLANIGRHAGAQRAVVDLSLAPHSVIVKVSDDGRGFDSGAVPAGHHGLALMQQRVELAGGTFVVKSVLNEGTCVTVEVPV